MADDNDTIMSDENETTTSDEDIEIDEEEIMMVDENETVTSADEKEAEQLIAARDYQIEIFEEACKKNVIACLGTGTGKTFISVMLIKELAHQIGGGLKSGGKRTFFLVTTVPLVYQQSKVIESQTELKVGKYTGDMNVDAWDKATWETEFNNHDVLVMTHQILLNNLKHAFIGPNNINLLILDECHHTSKNHPYKKIMELIEEGDFELRVMGLTASIINEKTKKRGMALSAHLEQRMKALEVNLRAVCFTCADQASILPYATRPEESFRVFEPLIVDNDPDILRVTNCMYEALTKQLSPLAHKEDERLLDKYNGIIKDLSELLSCLGIWCTYKAALDYKKNIGTVFTKESYRELAKSVVNKIIKCFEQYANAVFSSVEEVTLMEPMIAPKILSLMDLLVEMKQDRGLCCIIFVKKRITSKVVSELINKLAETFDHYSGIKSDFVHGHNLLEIMQYSDQGGMTSRKQEKILKRFREGEFNVLVGTSVIEEGLDVRKCSLVVKFDGVENYREYVQSKGRARAENSKYVVFAKQSMIEYVAHDIEGMREVENFLIKKSRGRELPTEEEIEKYPSNEVQIEPYKVQNGEWTAQISEDNAVQLLYRYCSMLPSDRYTQLVPTFKFSNKDGDPKAIVTLPLNCPLREEITGDPMPSRRLARISAAQKACIRLHQNGELDDNLLPISYSETSEDEDDDHDDSTDADKKIGAKQGREVYERKIPDCLQIEGQFPSNGLYLYELVLDLVKQTGTKQLCMLSKVWDLGERRSFGLLTAKRLPEARFPLYAKAGIVKVQVKLLETSLSLDKMEFNKAVEFHDRMLQQQYIEKYDPGCTFSLVNAISNGLLVAIKNSTSIKSMKRGDCLIDFAFMSKVCNDEKPLIDYFDFEDAVVRKTYADKKSLFYVTAVRKDKHITDRIADDGQTFKDYYKLKYEKHIHSDQPLLECTIASTKVNLIGPKKLETPTKRTKDSVDSGSTIFLVPELCEKLNMPASFHCQLVCIPSLLFRLETILAAEELRQMMMKEMGDATSMDMSDDEECISGCHDYMLVPGCYNVKRKSGKESKVMGHWSLNGNWSNSRTDENDVFEKMELFLNGKNNDSHFDVKPQSILQSLTTAKAHAGFNLERLETLGDSFLKVATSIYLYFSQPSKNEGRLTKKRERLVSNKKLKKLAMEKQIQRYMCNAEFGLKEYDSEEEPLALWIPPMFEKKIAGKDSVASPCQIIRDKSIADCVEALIGAFFEHGGINNALKLMSWFGIDCFSNVNSNVAKHQRGRGRYADFIPPLTALVSEPYEGTNFVQEQYKGFQFQFLEKRINYTFKEKSFLIQAFSHMSCYKNRSTDCYQRLEFLGDALLDFLIIAHLYACDEELDPSRLTSIKSALVNNNTFALLAVRFKLHNYLMHFEQKLHLAIKEFNDLEEADITRMLKNPFIIKFDNKDEEGFYAPKLLGDIFESLAGAVFLDSELDLVQVWKVFYPIMKPLIDQYMKKTPLHPVTELHELTPTASHSCKTTDDGKIICTWKVDGKEFQGTGKNKTMAKATAALKALSKLKT